MIRRGQPEPAPRPKSGIRETFSDGTVNEFWNGVKWNLNGGVLSLAPAVVGPGGQVQGFENDVFYAPHVWRSVEVIQR